MARSLRGALLLSLCAVRAVGAEKPAAAPAQLCRRLHEAGSTYNNVYACLGVPQWALVPALWTPLSLQVNCSAPMFEVFTAATWDKLHSAPQAVRWCGLAHFSQPEVCSFQLSPFEDVYVGMRTRRTGLLGRFGSVSAPEPQCSFSARRDLSLPKVAMAVLGVALFSNAHALTASTTFRLGAGTLTFMSGAALIVAFVLMRSIPHKRKLAAAMAVSASSVAAAARWAYGAWAPDVVAVLTSRGAVIYFLVTGLLGLGVTYWLDDASNVKLNNTVCAVLHLTGLMLVFFGTTSEPASLTLVGLLLASRILAPIARRMPAATRWLRARLSQCAKAGKPGRARIVAEASADEDEPADDEGAAGELPAQRPGAAGLRHQRRGGAPRREFLLSEDEEREAAEEARCRRREAELRSLREQELRAERRREEELRQQRLRETDARASIDDQPASLNNWLNGSGRAGTPRQESADGEEALQPPPPPPPPPQQQQQQTWRWPSSGKDAAKPVGPQPAGSTGGGGGWFSRWSNSNGTTPTVPSAEREEPEVPSPLHLRSLPPRPRAPQQPKEDEAQGQGGRLPATGHLRFQQHAAGQQQQRQRQRRHKPALLYQDEDEDGPYSSGESEDEDDGGAEHPAGEAAGVGRSPWSEERLVVDFSRTPGGASAARHTAPAGAARAANLAAAPTRAAGGGAAPAGRRTVAAAGRGTLGGSSSEDADDSGAAGAAHTPGDDISPLVRMGKIYNAESSRIIQIGKPKYEELLARGYTADLKNGVLLPPAGPRRTAGADSGGRSAKAVAGGGKARAPKGVHRG